MGGHHHPFPSLVSAPRPTRSPGSGWIDLLVASLSGHVRCSVSPLPPLRFAALFEIPIRMPSLAGLELPRSGLRARRRKSSLPADLTLPRTWEHRICQVNPVALTAQPERKDAARRPRPSYKQLSPYLPVRAWLQIRKVAYGVERSMHA